MNKPSHHRWLQREIDAWQQQGIITPAQAQQLSSRYPPPSVTGSWGKLIFTAIGAVIFGLGIILLFAYNWQAMHHLLKLALVLVAVLTAHGSGFYLWNRHRRQATAHSISFSSASASTPPIAPSIPDNRGEKIGESLLLLGTLLYGVGIFLVAQIYHIDEHYPNGILYWSLGALLLAWALYSTSQALLALLLLALWYSLEVFDFRLTSSWNHWLIALATVPLAWLKRSKILLFFSCAIFFVLFFISSITVDDDISFTGLMLLAIATMLAANWAAHSRFSDSEGILKAIGTGVYVSFLFLVCFVEIIDSLRIKSDQGLTTLLFLVIPILLTAAGFVYVCLRYRYTMANRYDRVETFLLLIASLSILFAAYTDNNSDALMVITFNLLFIAHAIVYLARGMQAVSWKQVSLGGAMMAAIIFARFVDLFDSLLLRSLAFLVIGATLFFLGLYFSRRSTQQTTAATHEQGAAT